MSKPVSTNEVPVYDSEVGRVATTLKFPYATVAERFVKDDRWRRYGLCIDPGAPLEEGIKSHDAVADYLDAHPDVAARYKADQTGAVKYFDVLAIVTEPRFEPALTERLNTATACPPGSIIAVDAQRLPPHILEMLQRKSSFPGGGLPPDPEVLRMAIVHADDVVTEAIRSAPGHALETWTCERGCGYDGNAADRIACEVCGRGKGD